MTDEGMLRLALACVGGNAGTCSLLRRGGRTFLALPSESESAARTLGLYRPQRAKARLTVALVRMAIGAGLHARLMPAFRCGGTRETMEPAFAGCDSGTAGVMLGSPEHRVRRAILSYRTDGRPEVAKLAVGEEGRDVIEGEVAALRSIPVGTRGVPAVLGLHAGGGATMMRMPLFEGESPRLGDEADALGLLRDWAAPRSPIAFSRFGEWKAIEAALAPLPNGPRALAALSRETLRPVIRHGDFARWNLLRQPDGNLMAIDWEWASTDGMPGIDIGHYFLQDERLVRRLPPAEATHATVAKLGMPACRAYLAETGWTGPPLLPILAGLAWKQGSGQQENSAVLEAALAAFR